MSLPAPMTRGLSLTCPEQNITNARIPVVTDAICGQGRNGHENTCPRQARD